MQENLEFNDKWHLASSNRESIFGQYHREGEPLSTGNVGCWYVNACYWRKRAEALENVLKIIQMHHDDTGNWHRAEKAIQEISS